MKFLVIVQDLRISGTSEGVVSRSFLGNLRKTYPNSKIDVTYFNHNNNDDKLYLLPVNYIQEIKIDLKIPTYILWINKIYWRLFHKSLKDKYIFNKYKKSLKELKHDNYDHIFIRSSGQNYETIMGAKDLPILRKAIINFHDPYPVLWDTGSSCKLVKLEIYKLMDMWEVVNQAKKCISPGTLLSNDMEHLYGTQKEFYLLPHQYDENVFDFTDTKEIRKKNKKIQISYHGAIQFTRNINVFLDAAIELMNYNPDYKNNVEIVLRIKGDQTKQIINKYSKISNIIILDCLDFANSAMEQSTQSDIVIILENCSAQSNILVGKAPFIASLNKPILVISPLRSEMRKIVFDNKYIATYNDREEMKQKLEDLIIDRMNCNKLVYPFGNYFGLDNFKVLFEKLLK